MTTGFHLYHGNRLETLAEALAAVLRADPAPPLAGETILVPHPGMAQWLKMRLADHLGIVAQVEFPLPAVWFGRVAGAGAAIEDSLAWRGDALVWRLFALDGEVPGPLADVTASDERGALARWQLAAGIGELFERYQLQRADWLDAWQHGRSVVPGEEAERWQRALWRRLLADAGPARRQALQRRLRPFDGADTDASGEEATLPRRLFVFGFASLPPLYLQGVQRLAQRLPVHLYFPNPCQWYWSDIRSERERLPRGRRLQQRPQPMSDEEGHPLLAGFGGVARDFLHQLYDDEAAFSTESTLFEPAAGNGVLMQMQNAILDLSTPALHWAADDRSLRLLRAPSRRRELEAVHDLLLDLFRSDLSLRPHEIAVLTPRLTDYAPLAEAVFGGQPPERRIRYQITDLSEVERHPLPAFLLRLLDLPVSRFGLGEVLDALARPAFAAAFSIVADELPRLTELLEQAGARWGLDGEFRARLDAGNDDAHTFRFAIDRLLAGWLAGDGAAITEDLAPYPALRGQDAELLGRFVACLDALDRWQRELRAPRSLGEWSDLLARLRRELLADSGDADEDAALLRLSGSLSAWREHGQAWRDIVVPRRLLREALAESLHSSAVSALPGEGVNLCAMVPLRGLPFRVLVLLGLSEGDFPRRERDLPDDLCRRRPRPGDRSRLAEDRYLLLEALISARSVLVLSHVDREPERGQPQPPSPVLAELLDHLRERAFGGDAQALAARIERVAPLSGDARHYTDSGQREGYVPSFADEWLAQPAPAPVSRPLSDTAPDDWRELRDLFTNPVRSQLRWRGVELAAGDEPVEDSEPLHLDGLDEYRLREVVLDHLDRHPGLDQTQALAQARALGLLPPGLRGAGAFAPVWSSARQIHAGYAAVLGDRQRRVLEAEFSHRALDGRVRLDVVDGLGLLRRSPGKVTGRRLLTAWLDLLALRLATKQAGLRAVLVGDKGSAQLHAPDDPGPYLDTLLDWWRQARLAPLPLFPRSSHAYAAACSTGKDREAALFKASATWYGDGYRGYAGEGDDAACAELARASGGWSAEPFETLALDVYAPLLAAQEWLQ